MKHFYDHDGGIHQMIIKCETGVDITTNTLLITISTISNKMKLSTLLFCFKNHGMMYLTPLTPTIWFRIGQSHIYELPVNVIQYG